MKFNEYPESVKIAQSDIFLKDGADGTKKVKYDTLENQIKTKTKNEIKEEESTDEYMDTQRWALLDNPNLKNSIFRGKNLGSEYTAAQKAAIQSGTFEGLFLGDYWEIGEYKWRIVDFDYWLGTGDIENLETHHIVVMPDNPIVGSSMNDSRTSEGGYLGSRLYRSDLVSVRSRIFNLFGETNVLVRDEYFPNAVSSEDGRVIGTAHATSTVDLPNELMMYGTYIFASGNMGNNLSLRFSFSKKQLSLFQISQKFIPSQNRNICWLLDPSGFGNFSVINEEGTASFFRADYTCYIRPVFGLC